MMPGPPVTWPTKAAGPQCRFRIEEAYSSRPFCRVVQGSGWRFGSSLFADHFPNFTSGDQFIWLPECPFYVTEKNATEMN